MSDQPQGTTQSRLDLALAAMNAAEAEAIGILGLYEYKETPTSSLLREWAHARIRLIPRDRSTLDRHYEASNRTCAICVDTTLMGDRLERRDVLYPCPEARAVIDYWTAS